MSLLEGTVELIKVVLRKDKNAGTVSIPSSPKMEGGVKDEGNLTDSGGWRAGGLLEKELNS